MFVVALEGLPNNILLLSPSVGGKSIPVPEGVPLPSAGVELYPVVSTTLSTGSLSTMLGLPLPIKIISSIKMLSNYLTILIPVLKQTLKWIMMSLMVSSGSYQNLKIALF